MKKIVLVLGISLALTSCQNSLVRKFGGDMTINLPAGEKLVNVTWKEGNDLWYLTRPMEANEKPTTSTFVEKSNMGILQGKVTIIESK